MDAGLIGSIVSVFAGLFGVRKAFRFVKEGERGALLRFGRFKRVVEPGFILVIPFIDSLDYVHVRQNTLSLGQQTVTLADNTSFHVQAVIVYKVKDVYRALYEIRGLDESIKHLGLSVMREALLNRGYQEAKKLEELNNELLRSLTTATESWGIELMAFRVTDFAPTAETSRVLLQAEAAKAQAEGNKILVEHLAELAKQIKGIDAPPQVLAALILRGNGGVPTVDVGLEHRAPGHRGAANGTHQEEDPAHAVAVS